MESGSGIEKEMPVRDRRPILRKKKRKTPDKNQRVLTHSEGTMHDCQVCRPYIKLGVMGSE